MRVKCVLLVLALCVAALLINPPQTFAQHVQPGQTADHAKTPNATNQTDSNRFDYRPITPRQRFRWFVKSTVGPRSLAGGLFSAGFGTAVDRPKEYGPHWGGFADRFGMRLTGISTGNAMEASLGALWGEDPRYFRAPNDPFGARVRNVIRSSFYTYRRDGQLKPAYARYIAIPGNNFLSNTWRVQSEANVHDAVLRTGLGFGATMAGNAFKEFLPDVMRLAFHRHSR